LFLKKFFVVLFSLYEVVYFVAGLPMCTLHIYHGGTVIDSADGSRYTGKSTYVDFVDCSTFSYNELLTIIKQLGYSDDCLKSYEFNVPVCCSHIGAIDISCDEDIRNMYKYTLDHCRVIDVYVEHFLDVLMYPHVKRSPMSPKMTKKTTRKSVPPVNNPIARKLDLLDVLDEDEDVVFNNVGPEEALIVENEGDDEPLEDKDNVVHDVEVDMRDYRLDLDAQVSGDMLNSQLNKQLNTGDDDELEVIDNDWFESASDSGEDEVDRIKARRLRKLRKEKSIVDDNAPFYHGQSFETSVEVK